MSHILIFECNTQFSSTILNYVTSMIKLSYWLFYLKYFLYLLLQFLPFVLGRGSEHKIRVWRDVNNEHTNHFAAIDVCSGS